MGKKSYSDLHREVVKNRLCVSCGACISACPDGVLAIANEVPVLRSACRECGGCYHACPIRDMVSRNKPSDTNNSWLGKISDVAVCRLNDKQRLLRVSSGGVVTRLLSLMLSNKQIDAALVLKGSRTNPLGLEAVLATTREEVLGSAQSKYICYPSLEVLRELRKRSADFKIAVVGLPCQISSLERVGIFSNQRIAYKLALYCGGVLESSVLGYILDWFGVKKAEVESLDYRYGSWPGSFRVSARGKNILIDKHTFNLFHLTHLKKGCLICDDFAGESGDLSFGDAWAAGGTVILARNKTGLGLLDMLKKDSELEYRQISPKQALIQHIHSAENKKIGARVRKMLILKTGYDSGHNSNKSKISYKRFLTETAYLSMLKFTSGKIGRRLISWFPIKAWGFIITKLRNNHIIKMQKKGHKNATI